MSFCQHEYAVLQIAKIQKFFELTKNIFPSTLASLFNALYINILFRNPTNPFRIPFPFLRWPFHAEDGLLPFRCPFHRFSPIARFISPSFAPPVTFFPSSDPSVTIPSYLSFLLPVSSSPFPSIISIHCPFLGYRFCQSFPFTALFPLPRPSD